MNISLIHYYIFFYIIFKYMKLWHFVNIFVNIFCSLLYIRGSESVIIYEYKKYRNVYGG